MKTVPGAALLALLLALSGNAVPGQHTDEFRFNVWFDQKPIGSHAFSISTDQATLNVRSNARFEFKLLFVPVYQYDHEAVEVWQGNCLESVNSTTRDNGKRYRVDLRPQDLLAETDRKSVV